LSVLFHIHRGTYRTTRGSWSITGVPAFCEGGAQG